MDWGFEGLFGGPGGYGRRPNPWESYQPYGTRYGQHGYTGSGRRGELQIL